MPVETPQLVTPSVWDTLALREGKDLDSSLYSYKLTANQFGVDVPIEDLDVDESNMSLYLPVASGVRRDGVGDKVHVEGIVTERHYKNPISLIDHGKQVSLPIARMRERAKDPESYTFHIDVVNQKAGGRIFFWTGKEKCDAAKGCTQYDHAKYCEECFHMAANGFLNSGSIGYSILDASPLEPDYQNGYPQGLDLRRILKLESSLVVLPASIDTVGKALTGGRINGKQPSEYFVKAFTPYMPAKKSQVVGGYTKSLQVPNYRKAEDLEESCETCQAYAPKGGQFGKCRMFDVDVGPEMTCDRWVSGEKSLTTHGPNCKCAACSKKYGKKSCGCDSCTKGHECSCGTKAMEGEESSPNPAPEPPQSPEPPADQAQPPDRPASHEIGSYGEFYRAMQQGVGSASVRPDEYAKLPRNVQMHYFRQWLAAQPDKSLHHQVKYITHDGNKWKVHAESGKVLGTHDSEKDAKAQLQAIEINKHKSLTPNDYSWTHESLKSLRGKYKADTSGSKPKQPTKPAQAPSAPAPTNQTAQQPSQTPKQSQTSSPMTPQQAAAALGRQASAVGQPQTGSDAASSLNTTLQREAKPAQAPAPPTVQNVYLTLTPSQAAKKATDAAISAGKTSKEVSRIGREVFDYVHTHTRNAGAIYQRELIRSLDEGMDEESAKQQAKKRVYELTGKNFSSDNYAYNTKSLKDLRDKYKTPKGRYHTVRKPQDGSATVTLGTKDVDKLRNDADGMGISVTWMSDDGKGNSKVKLSGGMTGIEKLATKHGRMVRKVKNLPQQAKSKNPIGTIEPDEEVVEKGITPTVSRERSSIGNISDPSSLLLSKRGSEEDGRAESTPVATVRGKNMKAKTKAADPLMDDTVKKPDDGGVHQEPGVGGEALEEGGAVTKEGDENLMGGGEEGGGGEEEAYGAQVTRRMHADMAGLLHEYDEFLNHTEDEPTRKIVLEQINHFIDTLEKLEQHFSTHERYKEYAPLDGMGQQEEDEEGMGGTAPSAAETGTSMEASGVGKETPPDGALEGMRVDMGAKPKINPEEEEEETLKSLYTKHVKSLRGKHKGYGHEVDKQEEEDEKEQGDKAKYLRKQLKMLGDREDANSKKLRAFYIKHIKKCDTLLQGKDKEHTPGSDKEKHDGMDITQEKTPKEKSLQGNKSMKDDKERDDEELAQLDGERKFLKSRWKSLKNKKNIDQNDKEEKSYIAYRWKALDATEKKLKSVANVKHRKDGTSANGVIGKFLKKFSKDHKTIVEDAEKFLKSIGDEENDRENLDETKRLKAYHHGSSLDKVLAHGMGGGDYTKGLENLQKALITEVDVECPSSNSAIGKPGHDKMPYDEGSHLISGKESFPKMGQSASVDVNEESSNSQLKVGHDKMPYDGQHLISSKESFPEMGKEGTIDVEDPSSNAVVARGIGKEPMQQHGVGGSLVKFMHNVADAGAFLKALAYEKAFGLNHRLIASRLAKALEMDEPFIEQFDSEFPGDIIELEGGKPKKDKKSMDEEEEDKAMPGMGGGMGGEAGGLGGGMDGAGGMPGLDEEEEDPFGAMGGTMSMKGAKFLDTLSHDTLAQSQTINALNQSLTNLMARLG